MIARVDLTQGSCDTVYGPVDSRRHGRSLGINLGRPDLKICTWGCVYCQCGIGERRDFVPADPRPSRTFVLDSVSRALDLDPNIDSITFAGNSEPTTHPEFSGIVHDLLKMRQMRGGRWIINALSNGSELESSAVVEACNRLDQVWIKLDVAVSRMFQRLSRPVTRVGSLAAHLSRIQRLDRLFLQTMLWDSTESPSLASWTSENRSALVDAYKGLRPQVVHLTTVARAPATRQLKAVPVSELQSFADQIREAGLIVSVFG